ncbi:unnamed protein product [Cuscuta campestris]|uniref:RecA family profile 1 domain-containing protein n=1 Tax=Cuscuta campestris TaxID=132261 RepID=A0A484MRI2_9ASTE|nr:unnamed protein product [Cuscuta campestris]
MAPLKSLELRYPFVDSNFRSFCAVHGIFSVEDFLLHDTHSLEVSAEQHHTSARLKQGIAQVLASIDRLHQPWLNGMEMLKNGLQHEHSLSTGSKCIDAFLKGGLRRGHLTELVGPSSSGKTQLCLLIASSVAKSSGKVIFVDTGNSFSPKRVAEFVNQTPDQSTNKVKKTLEHAMSNIVCYSVFDVFTMFDVLHQLRNTLRTQTSCKVRMLVIDSISSLITPVLGGSGAHGHGLMVSAGFLLKHLADEHELAVLVTNHMVAGKGGIMKPALGESWKGIPHTRLLLSRDSTRQHISTISVMKHPNMADGDRVEFQTP